MPIEIKLAAKQPARSELQVTLIHSDHFSSEDLGIDTKTLEASGFEGESGQITILTFSWLGIKGQPVCTS